MCSLLTGSRNEPSGRGVRSRSGSLAVISWRLTQIQPLVPTKRMPLCWPSLFTTGPVDVVVPGRSHVDADAVRVAVPDVVVGEGGVSPGDGLGQLLAFDLAGRDKADRPVGDVQVVRAPVGHRAARVVVPVAEIRVAALRHVADPRRLPQPEVPVQRRGHRDLLERAVAHARGQPHLGPLDAADAAVSHELARQPEPLGAALLHAGLQHGPVLAHGLDHVPTLLDRQRQGLLGVDVLAGPRRGDVDQGVPVVRRGVDYGVDVLALEEPAEIRVLRRDLAARRELLGGCGRVARVDIADGDDVAVVCGVAQRRPFPCRRSR